MVVYVLNINRLQYIENRKIVHLKAILHSRKALQLFGLGLNLSCQGCQSLTYWCYLLQVILPGIRCVRLRNELETFQKRLKLFEKRAVEDGLCRIKRHIKIRKGTPENKKTAHCCKVLIFKWRIWPDLIGGTHDDP